MRQERYWRIWCIDMRCKNYVAGLDLAIPLLASSVNVVDVLVIRFRYMKILNGPPHGLCFGSSEGRGYLVCGLMAL